MASSVLQGNVSSQQLQQHLNLDAVEFSEDTKKAILFFKTEQAAKDAMYPTFLSIRGMYTFSAERTLKCVTIEPYERSRRNAEDLLKILKRFFSPESQAKIDVSIAMKKAKAEEEKKAS